ncbi:cytochrome P450 [Rhodococcus sp. 27YEA15]|uniref:cytochrome P450 n=1 Tax=Rhodococcus sp. 27YEA15 TaxID=3156259 RepID=UPI003C7D77F6
MTDGIELNTIALQELASEPMFGDGGEFLAFVDPPRHTILRKALASTFTARAVATREQRIRELALGLVDDIPPGEVVDWVHVAQRLPVMVALNLLGLPIEDVDQVRGWSEAMERLSYPLTPAEMAQAQADFLPLSHYLSEWIARKSVTPADDLTSRLLEVQRDDESITDANVLMLLITVLAAGNDTMRSLLTGMVVALTDHPNQLEILSSKPTLVPDTIEESLRWVTPARGFLRTVSAPTTLRGVNLEQGQRVYLAYDSANRDEELFDRPYIFDIERPRTQQAAFGFGTHVCIGAAFARMEASALLTALLDRFPRFESAEPAEKMIAVLRNGWHSAPMRFFER